MVAFADHPLSLKVRVGHSGLQGESTQIALMQGDEILQTRDGTATVVLQDGSRMEFDAVYPMLGCMNRSELATRLGAECGEEGDLVCDAHLQTSIPGLYAAGDVVCGLNQVSVATGHAAIAATAIHNALPTRPR